MKPSKGAMELAKMIDEEWELVADNGFHFEESALVAARSDAILSVSEMIQSAMSDLLAKARRLRKVYAACYDEEHGCLPKSVVEFDAALELWKEPKS